MREKVFFLGAGFSKAIANDYPLMNQLIDSMKDDVGCNESELGNYYNHRIADKIKENIEDLLTYLSTDFPFEGDVQKSMNKALYNEITRIISDKFILLAKDTLTTTRDPKNDLIWRLSTYIYEQGKQTSFITLNYDLLLEKICLTAFSESLVRVISDDLYPFPIAPIITRSGGAYLKGEPNKNIPPILKLHGSANWYWSGYGASDTIFLKEWDETENQHIDAGLMPYIVPPVLDKNTFYNHIILKSLWAKAHKELSEAKEIYIIGFSFPPTDLSVRFLFQSALRINKNNPEIYIINTDSREKLNVNYGKVFGDNLNLNYDYCGSFNPLNRLMSKLQPEVPTDINLL